MSETPRTDEVGNFYKRGYPVCNMLLELSRQLERELAAVKADRDQAVAEAASCAGMGGGKDKPRTMVCPNGDGNGNCLSGPVVCGNARPHKENGFCSAIGECPACVPVDGAGKQEERG